MNITTRMGSSEWPQYEIPARLEQVNDVLHPYRGVIEALVMLPFYSMYMSGTLAYLKGFPKSRKAAAIGFPPRTISVHVFACLAVVGRYYSRLPFGEPSSDRLDLALQISQLATAWYLAKWSPSKKNLYRSSFLTMPLLMTIPVAMAFMTGSPQWHRTVVKCVEWFVHFRLVGDAMRKFRAFEPQRVPQDVTLHLVSVPVTLALANWTTAIPFYFVMLASVMLLNEWVTRHVPHNQVTRTAFVGFLVAAGLGERQTHQPQPANTGKNQ